MVVEPRPTALANGGPIRSLYLLSGRPTNWVARVPILRWVRRGSVQRPLACVPWASVRVPGGLLTRLQDDDGRQCNRASKAVREGPPEAQSIRVATGKGVPTAITREACLIANRTTTCEGCRGARIRRLSSESLPESESDAGRIRKTSETDCRAK